MNSLYGTGAIFRKIKGLIMSAHHHHDASGKRATGRKVIGANIIAVVVAHIPCCGSQLLFAVLGAHGFAAVAGGFLHSFELLVPFITASCITAYMLFLLRSEKRKHVCCASGKGAAHEDHKGRLADIVIFFFINILIGYAISFLVHEFFHAHHVVSSV